MVAFAILQRYDATFEDMFFIEYTINHEHFL